MSSLAKLSQKTIEYSFYALFFLVPLILTPWNYELFEFNKVLTVYALTAIIVGAWLIKMVAVKKPIFNRSFWDIPLLIFLISQFISFFFSIDRHTSFWGYYSRFNGGLLSTICYLLLYWGFVSNMNKSNSQFAIRNLLISGTLVAGYGIAEHFGIDAQYWVQDVRNRVFSTLGQPNWLAAWLAALAPIIWALALKKQVLSIKYQGILYSLFFILYTCLLYTRSRSGLLGFGVAYAVFWGLSFLKLNAKRQTLNNFLLFTFLLLFLTFLTDYSWIPLINKLKISHSPTTRQTNQTETQQINTPPLLISESGDIRKVVWRGAVKIWRHYPLFGTGPETFAYSYYWYRPREHNDLSEWDFLYNKAHNEYLNYAATTGTFGLGAYLLLIGSFVFWSLKKLKTQNSKLKTTTQTLKSKRFKISDLDLTFDILHLSLLSGFTSILVSNFFGFSVVPVQLLFFLFPAFAVTFTREPDQPPQTKPSITNHQLLITFPILLVTCYVLRVICYYWLADTHFARGEKFNKAGQYDLAFNSLQQAVKYRKAESVYYDELGVAAANLAVLAEKQNNATLSAKMAEIAISSSNKALSISPYNLNFLKGRTKIFYKLAELNPYYYQEALNTLLRAAELAPTEPKIRYNLALIYLSLNQQDKAIEALEQTIVLKPNYEDPRYALALLYEQKGEIKKAREQLEYILNKINPLSQRAKEKLKALK